MLLVTRPQPSAAKTAAALRARALACVVAPHLVATFKKSRILDLNGVSSLVVTSPQAARALKSWPQLLALPVYAVGAATAKLLRTAGFRKVTSADGNAAALLELIKRRRPKGGLLLADAPTTGRTLAADLQSAGFKVQRVSVYSVAPITTLPVSAQRFLNHSKASGVLFYSPRTAHTFVALVKKTRMQGCAKQLMAYCLSAAVAKAVKGLPWKGIVIADHPNEAALLTQLPSRSLTYGCRRNAPDPRKQHC